MNKWMPKKMVQFSIIYLVAGVKVRADKVQYSVINITDQNRSKTICQKCFLVNNIVYYIVGDSTINYVNKMTVYAFCHK